MGRKVQLRGGTSLEHTSFIGAVREITVDTTKNTVVVHDGQTYGGLPLAKESVTNDHETRITRIEGDGTVEGSITYKINNAINALKDGVSIDVDTLKELSDALNNVETDAATSLANSIVSLRNELRNGASINVDSFKEVEDLLTQVNTDLDARYTKIEMDNIIAEATDLTKVEGHILPTGNSSQDIGSPTNRFRAIYVDEAMLSTNTLYIGDTPVLGTDADTVVVKADPDQSILVKTTGTGTTGLQSESEVQVSTSGTNADVKIQATGLNSKVRFAGTGGIELSSPTTVQNDFSVTGNVNITGNVTIEGTQFIVDSTTVKTADNIIVLNDGEVGTGVTAGRAGIQIHRGDAAAFQLVFDEVSDKFIVGSVGGTYETLATREFVASEIGIEEDARLLADSTLQTNINNEKTARENADNTLQSNINIEKGRITTEISDRNNAILGVNNTIASLKNGSISTIKDLDNGISANALAIANEITARETAVSSEATIRQTNDNTLTSAIATEKARIDAILASSTADKNSFAEIVTLINSVDTTNDTAFGAYVTSNNNRVTTVETSIADEIINRANAISTLNTNLTNAINSEVNARVAADNNKVSIDSKQALHATDALRVSGKTLYLYKADGTAESITTQDTVYSHPSTHAASMITTIDEFANSNSTNVQDVLDDIDQALTNEVTNRVNAVNSLNTSLTNYINNEIAHIDCGSIV